MNCCQNRAKARLQGAGSGSCISGQATFRQCRRGVLVTVEVTGLPHHEGECQRDIFAMHIHSGAACTGNAGDPFADVGGHYDTEDCQHPNHAGDLPPLFGCCGYAYSSFLTDRFTVSEVIGRTLIIHEHPDDFVTQPSGNAGKKIACGQITAQE